MATTVSHERGCSYLVDHVTEVLRALNPTGPSVFAGDFNTWTPEHLTAVSDKLQAAGFHLAYSWKYPGKDLYLDHIFLRNLSLEKCSIFSNTADHSGAVFEAVL